MPEGIVLITGVSTGLGRAFAKACLDADYTVVGTVRKSEQVAEFEALRSGKSFARVLDVTDETHIPVVVKNIEDKLGPIYALINNAGYGHEGILEESPLSELREQFEVNVFGAVAMMQAVLRFMRQRRCGRIVNVTSMGGLMTMPGISFYHGSKFVLEGISSSLGKEVKSFGIFATALEPGGFRTDWAERSMVRSFRKIGDYDAVMEPLRANRMARDGNQPGDPAKAGLAVVKLLDAKTPPAHLLLGNDALEYVTKDLDALRDEFRQWEDVSKSTNFDLG
jgi:NAD(P)-dependent dehydrogenase (short-subunit alcohol dehydrogenase family)